MNSQAIIRVQDIITLFLAEAILKYCPPGCLFLWCLCRELIIVIGRLLAHVQAIANEWYYSCYQLTFQRLQVLMFFYTIEWKALSPVPCRKPLQYRRILCWHHIIWTQCNVDYTIVEKKSDRSKGRCEQPKTQHLEEFWASFQWHEGEYIHRRRLKSKCRGSLCWSWKVFEPP